MARPSRLSDAEVTRRLAALPGWTRRGDAITRTFTFAGFPDAVTFVTRLVAPAEALEHHPDVDLRYSKVIVSLSTHSARGLTELDFELAATIDALQA
ncbi:MAG: 4a-hydroxytetrahydrobiopterin dehydratase [Gemmatimonadaceae bacterium]